MASVPLRFIPPDISGVVKLKVWQSPDGNNPFTLIDETMEIGTFPDYIDHFTTDNATQTDYYFAISWEDDEGGESDLSASVRGGESTLLSKIVSRVQQRDPFITTSVIAQEAEAAITSYTSFDPYDEYDPVLHGYDVLTGLTYIVLARSMLFGNLGGASDSYTAGLVSEKSSSGDNGLNMNAIDRLIKEANKMLGISLTVVMLMEDIDPVGTGVVSAISWDHSRLALTLNYD